MHRNKKKTICARGITTTKRRIENSKSNIFRINIELLESLYELNEISPKSRTRREYILERVKGAIRLQYSFRSLSFDGIRTKIEIYVRSTTHALHGMYSKQINGN